MYVFIVFLSIKHTLFNIYFIFQFISVPPETMGYCLARVRFPTAVLTTTTAVTKRDTYARQP